MSFRDPLWLLALLALPAAFWLRQRRPMRVWCVPFAAEWHRPSVAPRAPWAVGAILAGFILLVLAAARPQRRSERHVSHERGYDIVLAIDLSRSMLTEDYVRHGTDRVSRIEVIRPVINAFIADRPKDRIGIVVFAGRAYTLSPLTFDHAWLARQLDRLQPGMMADGTAIGDGLALALTRLADASRTVGGIRQGAFVVLLTDGANNAGAFTPAEAMAAAIARGIPVHTVAIGTTGRVEMPVTDPDGSKRYLSYISDIDHGTLWRIASYTGGHFFNGHSSTTVARAFRAIDSAQPIQFQARTYLLTAELFPWLAVPGVALVAVALLVAWPRFGRRARVPCRRDSRWPRARLP